MSFWYAAFVKSGDEDNVSGRLSYAFGEDIKMFVPRREIYEKREGKLVHTVKVLFPGYVFMNGFIKDNHISIIRQVPNIYKLLMEGNQMAQIPDEEMNVFRHLMVDDVIGISNAIVENDEVVIIDGPLMSLKGRILRIDRRKGRAKIGIDFLGSTKVIDLGINFIVKVD